MFPEKRIGDARDSCGIEAKVLLPSGSEEIPCVITDISVNGACLEVEPTAELTDQFKLALPLINDYQDKRLVELRWRKGKAAGVRFVRKEP